MRQVCVVLAAAVLLSLGGGCSKKAGADTSAPDAGKAAYADEAGSELAQLEAYEAQLRALGIEPSRRRGESKRDAAGDGGERAKSDRDASGEDMADAPEEAELEHEFAEAPAPAAAAEPVDAGMASDAPEAELAEQTDRCSSLCMLSEAICELEVRICEMSEDHAEDASYVDACERAIDDCAVSGDACNTCSP